jgi:hypothetical protein
MDLGNCAIYLNRLGRDAAKTSRKRLTPTNRRRAQRSDQRRWISGTYTPRRLHSNLINGVKELQIGFRPR